MPATETLTKPEKQTSQVRLSSKARHGFTAALVLYAMANFALCLFIPKETRSIDHNFQKSELQGDLSRTKKPWSWWLARGYLAESGTPDIVVFGSSQMGSAQATADASYTGKWVDVLVHRHINVLESGLRMPDGRRPSVFSLAVPGAMISDNFVMTRALFAHGRAPKMVIATVSPRDFIDNTLPSPSATDQFKFFETYTDLGRLEASAYTDPFARMDHWLSKLPLRTVGTIYQKFLKQTTKSGAPQTEKAADVKASISATAADVGIEQWVVPPTIEAAWVDNTPEYKNRFRGPNMDLYNHQMKFMRAWLSELEATGTRVLVVIMPSMEMNRKLLSDEFWRKFRADLTYCAADNSASFMDLSDSKDFTQKDFLDTVHLKGDGGQKLFKIIAGKVNQSNVASNPAARVCPD